MITIAPNLGQNRAYTLDFGRFDFKGMATTKSRSSQKSKFSIFENRVKFDTHRVFLDFQNRAYTLDFEKTRWVSNFCKFCKIFCNFCKNLALIEFSASLARCVLFLGPFFSPKIGQIGPKLDECQKMAHALKWKFDHLIFWRSDFWRVKESTFWRSDDLWSFNVSTFETLTFLKVLDFN